jgi:hypothetical protein
MAQRLHLNYIVFLLLLSMTAGSQISIISIAVQPFNLTPQTMLHVNIMNPDQERQVQLVTRLFNSGNTVLLTVKSQVFTLRKGLNPASDQNRNIQSAEFFASSQADYLRSTHNLPSGRYKICTSIIPQSGSNEIADFCDELEADFNQYLYLINPFNGDTVESKNPILSWTHSEPFSILSQGEFYRMIVSEVNKEQSGEEAIQINTPSMVKNYLKEHQLQYPFDAKELKEGGRYAWQVQKISDGIIVNKTEVWTFYTRAPEETRTQRYVAMKRELDGSYCTAYNGIVYFKFSEEYRTPGELKYKLSNAKSQAVEVQIKKEEGVSEKESSPAIKSTGTNRFELNMNAKQLPSGFYTLEVRNEKNELFYLKIFLP